MKQRINYEAMLLETFNNDTVDGILKSYMLPPVHGLRFNPFKKTNVTFEGKPSKLNPEILVPSHYAKTVTHPAHHAGAYYIQDPSATIPVKALQLSPEDVVCDLCAAPGGKSTQILSEISNGFLIANEIDAKRNQKLVNNIQRWGCENFVVTQMNTEDLSNELESVFDKVLLDAPCSGEGLFRRMPEHLEAYTSEKAYVFQTLQNELLEHAFNICKPDGIIVYSTCTLNVHENEEVILHFLANHPECKLETINAPLASLGLLGLDNLVTRYFPSENGEGHFVARIRVVKNGKQRNLRFTAFKNKPIDCYDRIISMCTRRNGDEIIGLKSRGYLKEPLNITHDGTILGIDRKNRIDYSHELSLNCLFYEDFDSLSVDCKTAYQYLFGLQINSPIKGYHRIVYEGLTLGFAKGNGKIANNRYPKGLRNKFESYEKI